MHVTLKMIEKLDHLLDESESLIECATKYSDDTELKAIYYNLAKCHYDGYDKLSKYVDKALEKKATALTEVEANVMREMVAWHKGKFETRAMKVKHSLESIR